MSSAHHRGPHRFDPERAPELDRPERQQFLPNERVLDLLELAGDETVIDYGAGSGTLTFPLARRLHRGTVHAVDESPEMMDLFNNALNGAAGLGNIEAHEIRDDNVPLEDGCAPPRTGGKPAAPRRRNGSIRGDAAPARPRWLSAHRRLAGGCRA